jgi:hypothetical protein
MLNDLLSQCNLIRLDAFIWHVYSVIKDGHNRRDVQGKKL